MSFGKVTSREAVEKAIAEFRRLDRVPFLQKYRFGKALEWFVEEGGSYFDSKAIYGAAFAFETGQPLVPADFSGGEASVVRQLRALGFTVVKFNSSQIGDRRNPDWTRDEVILVLDRYIEWRGKAPGKTSKEISDLSAQLFKLNKALGAQGKESMRNSNGVYMKLMNFRSLDPAFLGTGRSGLANLSEMDRVVWQDFYGQAERLHQVADVIREALLSIPIAETQPRYAIDTGGIVDAAEGRIVTVQHLRRERSAKLVHAKKLDALRRWGRLACETCSFNFADTYGAHGEGFIECHHTKPLMNAKEGEVTHLRDLALLCANCHRMIHARTPWLSLTALLAILRREEHH